MRIDRFRALERQSGARSLVDPGWDREKLDRVSL